MLLPSRHSGVGEAPLSRGAPKVYVQPKTVPFTPSRSVAAREVAGRFIADAVLRGDVDASFALTAPVLRQGLTRAGWRTGNIPVVPYPAAAFAHARWKLSYSYADRVGLLVLLLPKPNASARPAAFTMELRAFGQGAHRRWLVASWAPAGVANPTPADGVAAPVSSAHPLNAVWLLVPGGIFGLALLVSSGLVLREWRRSVRASRTRRPGSGSL